MMAAHMAQLSSRCPSLLGSFPYTRVSPPCWHRRWIRCRMADSRTGSSGFPTRGQNPACRVCWVQVLADSRPAGSHLADTHPADNRLAGSLPADSFLADNLPADSFADSPAGSRSARFADNRQADSADSLQADSAGCHLAAQNKSAVQGRTACFLRFVP